jgi:hypothetical protein
LFRGVEFQLSWIQDIKPQVHPLLDGNSFHF